MKKFDIVISVILMAVAAAMFVAAGKLPAVEGAIGAGAWPKTLSVALFFLAIPLLIQGLLDHSGQAAPFDIHSPGFRRVLIGIGIIVIFCVLLKYVGFLIASACMVPAIMRLMDEKRIPVLVGVTVGVLAAVYVIFAVLLHLPLPQGVLF